MNIQYITDEKGKHTAVVVPIEEWEKMKKENEQMKNKLDVLNGIADALEEVQNINEGKRIKGRPLREYVHGVDLNR
jgi:hypothetical protein